MPAFAAKHFLPAEGRDIDLVPVDAVGEHRAGRVGEAQPLAVGGDPLGVGNAHAADVVPFQVNRTSFDQSTCAEVGKGAIIGADHGRIELQLLDRVGHPAFAEAFPRQRRHRRARRASSTSPFRTRRCRIRGRCRCGGVSGSSSISRIRSMQACRRCLPSAAAMRPAEHARIELVGAPARRLGAGAGREIRPRGTASAGVGVGHSSFSLSSQRARAALGRRGPPPAVGSKASPRNGLFRSCSIGIRARIAKIRLECRRIA